MAHAIVKATNTGTNIVQTAITDSSGDFVITPVAAGTYSLNVTATGFHTINASNIEVQVKMGQNQHYRLSVQQQLSPKTVFDIAYVGNHGLHLQSTDDFNEPSPAAGAVQGRRQFQPWGAITFQSQDLGTTYQALQAKIERRVFDGITGLISYTWSKFMQSNQSPPLGGNIGSERTYSQFNTPQNLAISGSYQLPVGRGRKYKANSSHFVDAVLGGWQVQTIIVLRSGTPYTPVVSTDRANTGVGKQRPNINPAGGSPTFHKTLSSWFDKTAYVVAHQFTYGQVKAFTLQSEAFRQYDASIFKNFALPGESVLSFRVEFFNLPNTTNFNAPSATIDASSCCTVTSTSIPSRDIQLVLKYNF